MTKAEEALVEAVLKFAEEPEMVEAREDIRGSNSAAYSAEFANFMDAAVDVKQERCRSGVHCGTQGCPYCFVRAEIREGQ